MAKKRMGFLGVDLGASGIKVVELANENGRAKLVTYGFSERPNNIISDSLEDMKAVAKELRDVCDKAGITTKRAVTGLPVAKVFSTIFSFKDLKEKELASVIKDKATSLSPIPADDMVIDWKKITEKKAGEIIQVSVTIASKKLIDKYVKIFKIAGLELVNLETEAFALIRSLLGKDKSPTFIVDVGSVKSNILVVKDNVPFIHKSVKVGGGELTAKISNQLGLSLEESEKVKRSFSIKKMNSIKPFLTDITKSIVNEIKYSQEFYKEQYRDGRIEKIILTGGGSVISGLSQYLKDETGFRTFLGDPWTRVLYPKDLRPVLDKIGPRFSIAVGLSLRDID